MINELYQDAHDDHGTAGDGYIAPLSESTRQALAQLWTGTAEGSKLRPLEKYQLLLVTAGHSPLERGAQPYQDADLVIQLRNVIAHYQPKDLAADSPTKNGAAAAREVRRERVNGRRRQPLVAKSLSRLRLRELGVAVRSRIFRCSGQRSWRNPELPSASHRPLERLRAGTRLAAWRVEGRDQVLHSGKSPTGTREPHTVL